MHKVAFMLVASFRFPRPPPGGEEMTWVSTVLTAFLAAIFLGWFWSKKSQGEGARLFRRFYLLRHFFFEIIGFYYAANEFKNKFTW
jgi:hypothetical protein